MSTEHEAKLVQEFDRWAQDGTDKAMERGHGRFTELALEGWDLHAEHRVLDIGCGNGWAVRRCMELGAGDGVGVDISAEMIAAATPPGRYLAGPADALPFEDASFTHLLSVEALYYTEDPAATLREWRRVAQPGARLLLLMDLYRENPCHQAWKPLFPFPVHVLGEDAWAAMLGRCGWRVSSQRRILDPRGIKAEADFEPNDWSPTYAAYVAEKQAGTLCLEAEAV